MSKSAKWIMGLLVVIAAVSVAAVVFMAAQRPDTDEDEQEAVKAPSHVAVQDGRTVLKLDAPTQARDGIRVESLAPTSMRAELRGTAVLLPVSDLAVVRNAYVAARAKLQRDQVDLQLARTQYERVKILYDENQNMSLKAMQDAEAAYRNTQAQVTADGQETKLQLDAVRQRWGTVPADWMAGQNPALEPVLEQRDFLVQVVFPPGEVARPPVRLALSAPGKQTLEARYLSPMPQVNPQIQGVSFLYLAPGRPGMAVGMNLVVEVPVGQRRDGVVVPDSAVVWWQGKAWLYEESAPATFTRRDVPTDNPRPGGYFIAGHQFPAGTKIVVAGAQALLSEEFRSQIQQED